MVKIKENKMLFFSMLTWKRKNKEKKKLKKGLNSVLELVPFKCMEENNVVKKDGSYTAFLKVKTKNINTLSADEQYRVMHQLELLMRICDSDFSIISMMFPTNVDANIRYWNKKLLEARQEKDKYRIKTCQEQLSRMLWVEMNLSNLEFYFQVYGKTKKDLNENKRLLKRLGGSILGITDVSPEDTQKIIYKLLNLNTEI